MVQFGTINHYQRKYYLRYKEKIQIRDKTKRLKARLLKLCKLCKNPCLDLRLKLYCSFLCYKKGAELYNREWKRQNVINGWFIRYKRDLGGCVSCGYNKCLAALDFHHTRDKEKSPSGMKNCSKAVGMLELNKCVLLCANCHREETWRKRHED